MMNDECYESDTVNIYGLRRADLEKWLSQWSKKNTVYCPDEKIGHGTASFSGWKIWEGDALPKIKPGPAKCSIKTFYFPQPETLHTFSTAPDDPDAFLLKEAEGDTSTDVLVGVRPCDARAVYLNGLPYSRDPYFQYRDSKTILVGFSCLEQCSTCFCQDVGGSPFDTQRLDIAITEIEDRFIAEVLSDRGKALVKSVGGADPASDKDRAELDRLKNKAKILKSDPSDNLKEKELMGLYNAGFWNSLADPCLNCGICTFLCPTCYCFDIQDEVIGNKGRRIRYWDSCMFPLFTQHASGHNPRGLKMQRVRNRFMHKLKYFPDRFGPLSCVGCGRCIRDCPVNIDIREVLQDLLSVE